VKKTVIIPVIVVLVAVLAVAASFLFFKMNALAKSESQVASLNDSITGLNTDISNLQTKLTDSQTSLTTAQDKISSLEDDITAANAAVDKSTQDLKAAQNVNSALTQNLKNVSNPRHFQSVSELTDWLAKDDTNTMYKDSRPSILAYILQVRALRSGYILPTEVSFQVGVADTYWENVAVIDGDIWLIDPSTDALTDSTVSISPVPSHPEILP
jgi:hypothetical protein